jgi:putative spermidine/putrescine transport system permease protein
LPDAWYRFPNAFAFVLSLNEHVVVYMIAGFTIVTLPIRIIFNSFAMATRQIMASVTVVFVVLAALGFGLIARFDDLPGLWVHGRQRKNRARAASRQT